MAGKPSQERVMSFAEARACVEQHARAVAKPGMDRVPLQQVRGRVLAEAITADRDYPPFHRATRDGYAVCAPDVDQGKRLKIIGQIKAGDVPHITLQSGECVEIMTGGPLPAAADAVVMVEHTRQEGDHVIFQRRIATGDNVVQMGSEAGEGSCLVAPGTRLGPAHIGVAATVGRSLVSVFRKPRVAILSTGDELVEIDQQPGESQIRNSNVHGLAAQVEREGADPVLLPIAPDEPSRLRKLIGEGLKADLLLLSGGVSMGKYDLVELALREFQTEFFFTGVLIQPGKPAVFGKAMGEAGQRFVLGLPGNPVSTLVTFELFAKPLIEGLCGASISPLPQQRATLKTGLQTKPGLTRFLPARLLPGDDPEVEIVAWRGSGDIFAAARADCLLVVPPDKERLAAGESVRILPL